MVKKLICIWVFVSLRGEYIRIVRDCVKVLVSIGVYGFKFREFLLEY